MGLHFLSLGKIDYKKPFYLNNNAFFKKVNKWNYLIEKSQLQFLKISWDERLTLKFHNLLDMMKVSIVFDASLILKTGQHGYSLIPR